MRILAFFSKPQETHARSTPTFSHLLLNNRKRQDLKSCSVALCAITFQLRPCFPWNCAPLEQKNYPAIQSSRFQAKKPAIFANFCILVDVSAIWCYISLPIDILLHDLYKLLPFINIFEPCYKIRYTTYKMIWMSRHNIVEYLNFQDLKPDEIPNFVRINANRMSE